MAEGERGAGMAADGSGAGSVFGAEKDIDLSDVGVDSSMAEGAPVFCPPAACSCCSCCCWVRIICKRRFYHRSEQHTFIPQTNVPLELLAPAQVPDVSLPGLDFGGGEGLRLKLWVNLTRSL